MSDMPNTANTSAPANQNGGAVPAFPRVAPAKTAADLAEAKRRLRDEELERRIDAVRQKYDRLKRIAAEPINAQREAARIAAEAELTRLQGIIDRDPDSLEAQMARLEIANINRNLSALFARLDAAAYRNVVKIDAAKNQEILAVRQGDSGIGGRQPGLLARLFRGQAENAGDSLYKDLQAISGRCRGGARGIQAENQAVAGPAGVLLARVGLIRRELGRATPESLEAAKRELDRLPAAVEEVLKSAESLKGRRRHVEAGGRHSPGRVGDALLAESGSRGSPRHDGRHRKGDGRYICTVRAAFRPVACVGGRRRLRPGAVRIYSKRMIPLLAARVARRM